jgi:hypothetical protein
VSTLVPPSLGVSSRLDMEPVRAPCTIAAPVVRCGAELGGKGALIVFDDAGILCTEPARRSNRRWACFVLAQCAALQRCRAMRSPVSFVLTYQLWARAADLNVALDWAMVGIFVCAGQASLSPTALHARLRSTERAARAVRSAAGRSLRKPSPRLACDVPCASRALKVCSATSRLLVHEKIYDVFIERLLAHAKAIKLGDPFDESVGRSRSAAHCSSHPALQTRPRHVARNGALWQRAVRCGASSG